MHPERLKWVFKDYPIYYFTIVSYDRRAIFARPYVQEGFLEFANRAIEYGVAVGRYTLMPAHLHLFAAFHPESISVSQWIKSLKNSLSKSFRAHGIASPHFQKGFFDHVLRTDESYGEKWEYMVQNPVRAGLVQRPEEWKFQGEVHHLGDPGKQGS